MKKLILFTLLFIAGMAFSQPGFMWTKQFGGNLGDEGVAIAVDKAGNVITAGNIKDTVDADPGPGTQFFYGDQLDDILITKLDAAGNLVWAKTISGMAPGYINVTGMSLLASNNIVLAGYFTNIADFDPGAGTYTVAAKGGTDGFACCLDANGNFKWVKTIGGSGTSGGTFVQSMGLGIKGDVLLTGYFKSSADFDPGIATHSLTALGNGDAFLCKLDSNGTFKWAQSYGDVDYYDPNTVEDCGLKVGVDANDNIYLAGTFESTADFDASSATYTLQPSTSRADIFILKVTPAGNFVWVRQLAGPDVELVNALKVSNAGEVYMTGLFESSVDVDPGIFAMTLTATTLPNSWYDAFLLKLDVNGNYSWAKQLTGEKTKTANGLYVTSAGDILLTGTFYDIVDFDPGPATHTLAANAPTDIYLLKLNPNGSFGWVYQMGGIFPFIADMNTGKSITCDAAGNIYTTGKFAGSGDMDPTNGTYTLSTPTLYTDMYVMKLGGIVELEKNSLTDNGFHIFPNPTSGVLKIKKENNPTKVKLYNALGAEVMGLSSSSDEELNLSALPKGIYFVEITSGTEVVTRKIVKD
ncbi:MAG: T9SS type A sorting domain-containing protein [Bacteroidia bacterium]